MLQQRIKIESREVTALTQSLIDLRSRAEALGLTEVTCYIEAALNAAEDQFIQYMRRFSRGCPAPC